MNGFRTTFVSSEDTAVDAAVSVIASAATNVVVSVTYASLGKLVDAMRAVGQRPGLIVFDEAYHCVADGVYRVIADHLVGICAFFFTATPMPQMLAESCPVWRH